MGGLAETSGRAGAAFADIARFGASERLKRSCPSNLRDQAHRASADARIAGYHAPRLKRKAKAWKEDSRQASHGRIMASPGRPHQPA